MKEFFKSEKPNILFIVQRIFYFFFLSWVRHLFLLEIIHQRLHQGKLDRPLVIVSNHISNWDSFLIFSSMHRKVFTSSYIWKIPAYHGHFKMWHRKIFYRMLGVFPLKREETLEKSMAKSVEVVKKGHSTIFFPEGKRVSLGEKAKTGRGIGYLLKNTQAYILPVHIQYHRRNKDGFGAYPGKAKIIFGEMVRSEYFVENFEDNLRHEAVMSHIRSLPKQIDSASGRIVNSPNTKLAIPTDKIKKQLEKIEAKEEAVQF